MTDEPSTSYFIDTHAHLDDDQFAGDVDVVLERARAAGVQQVINIGYRPRRWDSTIRLAAKHPMVRFTLGLHPHHADEWSADTAARLESLIETSGALAVGEVGIDLFRDGPPLATQQDVFDAQLRLAARRHLPVVIHQRAAESEVLDVLGDAPRRLTCVLHSFEGSDRMASFGRDRDYYFGVGGLMTRSGSTGLRDVLKGIPIDRLLLETDSPYLVPAGVKRRRNEPANIPGIAEGLAQLLSRQVEEIQRITTSNACRAFGLPAGDGVTR